MACFNYQPCYNVTEATGAFIRPSRLEKKLLFPITDYGASPENPPVRNTEAINSAIEAAARAGGGTVTFPRGIFYTYTILLQSNVNLYLEEGAVVAAAKTDIANSYEQQTGEGGNYAEPEANPYIGIQDHGHSYFANSLVYGADLENISICGKGLFTGGRFDSENDILEYVLLGGDPPVPDSRLKKGHRGEWFGNKGISLVRCKNIAFEDFSITIGGHFAIITTGCEELYVNNILIDTTRDAFDIDCCRNVTVENTTCNSLTDDGLCLKSSFGAGRFMPLENVLIKNCVVSGYDAGSVYAGEYSRNKLVAEDRCGPTGRVKFGTESTCGYRQVTIRGVKFHRSRGLALEAVDGSSLSNVIIEDCEMDDVSSSPIFIRAGERGRFPVTGLSSSTDYPAAPGDVRLDNPNWVLPNAPGFETYPVKRYTPHYNRTRTVTADGHSFFEIVDEKDPVQCNPANYVEQDGHYYLKKWTGSSYEPDYTCEIPEKNLPLYANGVGCESLATVEHVLIRNIRVTNADPRYPIILMGLTDSHLNDITLERISIEYRGGLSMQHAVEQRQLNTEWKYSQFHAKERIQNIPWLVNTFFLKNEGLLPRADWDAAGNRWRDDPYNVPELPEVYPEPSNWGILPAYGIFAKHVDKLAMHNITITCKVPDGRHVCVLDDINHVSMGDIRAAWDDNIKPIALITHHYRRHTNAENVPEQPYFTTTVKGLTLKNVYSLRQTDSLKGSGQPSTEKIEITAPAPGTPRDSLYPYPTVPCQESGYRFAADTDDLPLPRTVYRPYICPVAPITVHAGEEISFTLSVRNPASEVSAEADSGIVYNERARRQNYSVKGVDVPLAISCEKLPSGAAFSRENLSFSWIPAPFQKGEHRLRFMVADDLFPENMEILIQVLDPGSAAYAPGQQ